MFNRCLYYLLNAIMLLDKHQEEQKRCKNLQFSNRDFACLVVAWDTPLPIVKAVMEFGRSIECREINKCVT